jgi:hypothetical protein
MADDLAETRASLFPNVKLELYCYTKPFGKFCVVDVIFGSRKFVLGQ